MYGKGSLVGVKKKYIYAGFSFSGLIATQKSNFTRVCKEHELLLLIEEKWNISIWDSRKSIYWVVCLISTFFIIEGKIYRKVFFGFIYDLDLGISTL